MDKGGEAYWLSPEHAPKLGMFLAKFVSKNDVERIVVLNRYCTVNGAHGVAGNMFEWDMGKMIGWYPLPDGLE